MNVDFILIIKGEFMEGKEWSHLPYVVTGLRVIGHLLKSMLFNLL